MSRRLKRQRIDSNTSWNEINESSKFYSKFNKIKALFDEIQHKNIDIKLERVLANDEML